MRKALGLIVLLGAFGSTAQASIPSRSAAMLDGSRHVTYRLARPLINHRARMVWEVNGADNYSVFQCSRDNPRRMWCLVSYYRPQPEKSYDVAEIDAIYVSLHSDRSLWVSDSYGRKQVTVTPEKP